MSDPVIPELPSNYYLLNFWQLIDGVTQRYEDLLTAHEQQLIATLRELSENAQQLYVRLLCRKGTWFRLDKLKYPEIGKLDRCCQELEQAGLLRLASPTSWEVIGKLCTVAELKKLLPLPAGLKKALLIEQLQASPIPELPFTTLELQENDWLQLFLLLYFNNARQDLTEFVLSDLELKRYEHYRLDRKTRLYQSREAIEQALALAAVAQAIEESPKGGDWPLEPLLAQLPEHPVDATLTRRRQRLTEKLAREYERRGADEIALALYQPCHSAFSRERQLRLLAKQRPERAWDYLHQCLNGKPSLSEQQFLHGFGTRLAKKLKQPFEPATTMHYQRIDWPEPRLAGAPEQSALMVLAEQGWQGVHCENALINGLLTLTFWPALFADDIPGAFFHPFQSGPADLYRSDFWEKRAPLKAQLLDELLSPQWPQIIRQRYQQKWGLANPLFDWHALPEPLLEAALERIPQSIWHQLFNYQLDDLRLTRAGMPDLFIWNSQTYGWVEVKGPSDKLQNNQLLWLDKLQRLQQNVAVCYLGHQQDATLNPLPFVASP